MSFPRYPKYKESGVDWLGEVPEHWDIKPIRQLAREGEYAFVDGDWIESPYIVEEGVRLIQTGNIGVGQYKEQGFRYISPDTFEELRCTEVCPGDVLICRLAEPVGRACEAPDLRVRMITSVDVCILKTGDEVSRSFIVYRLSSKDYLDFLEAQCRGGTRDRVSRTFLGAVRLAIPPLAEQRAIASFLDHETAKIDALVADQHRLIELLKEKRRALISRTIAKGLNPDAPMKPSGVEWLGDVPAHWEVRRVKSVLREIKAGPFGSSLTKDMYVSSGYRVYGQEQVIPADFTIGDYYISEETYRDFSQYSVQTGDILISCVGTFGKIAIVPADAEPGIINPRLMRLRPNCSVRGDYLAELLRSPATFEQFAMRSRGGTMDVINIGTLTDIVVAVPPIEEQNLILGSLQDERAGINGLTAEAERAIALLEERRTALISAAVAGKVDVRGLVRTEPVAA